MTTDRSVARAQPQPGAGKQRVQDELRRRFEGAISVDVFDHIWEKALAAQAKYGLKTPGLYTFNGREALLDAYQDLLDAIVYLMQHRMECDDQGNTSIVTISDLAMLLALAERLSDELLDRGIIATHTEPAPTPHEEQIHGR